MSRLVCALSAAALMLVAMPAAAQHAHGATDLEDPAAKAARAARAKQQGMGFDLAKAEHHFKLYSNGGALEVSVKDEADQISLSQIRVHLHEIETKFGDGDFKMPMAVHGVKVVPGTAELAKLKDRIVYAYMSTDTGGVLNIVTADPDAVKAVHTFLEFQIAEHGTGDSTEVVAR